MCYLPKYKKVVPASCQLCSIVFIEPLCNSVFLLLVDLMLAFSITAVPPGPPPQPKVDEITPNSVTLSWDKPIDSGGGKIKGYKVEKKDKDGEWQEVTISPVQDTQVTVPHLKEGTECQFRVTAINEAGEGSASRPTDLITLVFSCVK